MLRVVFFFQGAGATWTESYYFVNGGGYGPAVFAAVKLVAQKRAGFLALPYQIVAIRLSNPAFPRLAIYVPLGQPIPGSFAYTPATEPDEFGANYNLVVLTKYFGGTFGHVDNRYHSGVPEGYFDEGPLSAQGLDFTPAGALTVAFASFLFNLVPNWGFRIFNWANQVQVTQVVTNAQFAGEIGLSLPTQLTFLPNVARRVNLKGFQKVNTKQPGLQGYYSVDPNSPGILANAAPYIYYLLKTPLVTQANISKPGFCAAESYLIDMYSTSAANGAGYSIVRATHRKRGASALAPRGRSRTRVSANG